MKSILAPLALLSVLCGQPNAADAPKQKPNIILILADDLGYGDLGCQGLKTAKTPHFDQFAAEGTRFTSFYTQPVCGPARSALLTGRYPSRSGGWSMPATEITFAELMRGAGYATACIGKWDVSNRKAIIERMPNAKGFDYYYGPLGANDAGHVVLYENNTLLGEDKDLASLSRRYTDKAIAWLKRHQTTPHAPGAQNPRPPFLLYLCHTMMHTVIDASPEFRDRTGNGLYADTLQELDHECGRLLAALDDLGLRENTLVIFTSDNGAWSNDLERQHAKNAQHVRWSKGPEMPVGSNLPLREGKASSYEGGVRVPCLVRWPGKVPASRVSNAVFATLDLMPTFANLCGFTVPQDRVIDGVDQIDLLLGKSERGKRDTYFYHSGDHGVRQGKWKLLRADRWKGHRNTYPKDLGTGGVELYNLDEDISETKNLAAEHPDIVARLGALKLPDEKPAGPRHGNFEPGGRTGPAKGQPKAKAKGKAKAAAPATAAKAAPTSPSRSESILNYREAAPEYVFDTIPFWWKGEFHLFYLNCVLDAGGEKVGVKWSHARTKDYVHWEKMPDAVLPGELDANVWTGSLIEKDGVFHLFYTGKSRPEKPDPRGDQKVMVATSTDLVHFTKQPQRTFYADGKFHWSKRINGPLRKEQGRDETFRDPEVTWIAERNEYWMLLHSRHPQTQDHQFGVYHSDDLLTWTPRSPLQTVGTNQRNLDCPDIFPLGGRWHIVFSGCRTASADRPEGPFGRHRSYENNHFVGKVTFDDKGRALTVATVRPGVGFTDKEGRTTGGLGGRASMVREFYITEEGRLAQRPLPEVLAAFSHTTHTLDDLAKAVVTGQPERVTDGLRLTCGAEATRLRLDGVAEDFLAEFSITLAADSVFRVNFRQGGPETYFFEASTSDNHVRIGNPWHHSDSTKDFADRDIRLPADKPIRVRLFANGDTIECFVEDHIALTMNAYDLHGPKLVTQVTRGSATIHDFAVKQTLLSAPVIAPSNPQAGVSAPRHPDVLFIAFDDLSAWTTLFDPSFPIKTPNLERLARRGAFFTNAYCAAPACGPSRASVLSGLRPTTTGMYNNPDPLERHHRDTVFLPQYFQQHGYSTWGVGKILHGEPLHAGDPSRPIWQQFTKKEIIQPPKKLNGPDSGPGKNATYDWGQVEGPLGDDRTLARAIEYLGEKREGPVFQAVGIFSPHLPHFARKEHFDQYPTDRLVLPPMPKDDFDDIPAAGRAMADFQKDWNRHLFAARDRGDLAPLSQLVRSYQAAATYGDEILGKLLDALEATGRADRTIIVLWSDHGYHLGDKDSVVKFTLWERADQIPFIIVAPGVTTPGSRISAPVSLVDIYPTLVELAGLPPKPRLDGRSLVPLLRNPDAPWPYPAVTTWLRGNHAVRSPEWRFIHYADGSEELYSAKDPWNHTNLAAKAEHATVLAEHRKWLPATEAPAGKAEIKRHGPETKARPNVVIVLSDDQGYGDLSCHGNPVLKTPHLDRLHAEGLRLTDFHVSPVCSPTRAALLTGLDPLRAGIWATTTDRGTMLPGLPTMAEVFAAGGYRTGLFGKWHLGDAPPYRPQDRGFHETLYEPGGMIGMSVEAWNNDVIDPVLQHNGSARKFTGYREDVLFDEAMGWMRQCRGRGQPFLALVATLAPHGPHWVPEKYAAPYRDGPGERAADFFGMIANLDENLGRLEGFLAKSGLRENTVLIFMTDNGGTAGVRIHNAGMRGNKGDPTEGGHRVPCFIRWPAGGLAGGRDIGGLTAHIDLLPTLADLCGLADQLPPGLDGLSLAPLLRGEVTDPPPRCLFVCHDQGLKDGGSYLPDPFEHSAVLSGPWRLIEGRELYHIGNDPGQERDIAAQHPGRVRQLREAQEAHWAHVFPRTFEARRPIEIDGETVSLTPLSARPIRGAGHSSQRHVRGGQPSFAEWTVRVLRPARYRLEARRWPAETGAALTADLPAFKGSFVNYPPGKALPIAALRVRIADIDQTIPAEKCATAVATTLALPPGEHRLTARFLDAQGREITDAYFLNLSISP